jgi:hypothetical protein
MTVALMRAVEADNPNRARSIQKPGWIASLKGFAVAIATPQAAFAAAAVIALAVSITVVISRQSLSNSENQDRASSIAQEPIQASPSSPPSVAPEQNSAPAVANNQAKAREERAAKSSDSEEADKSKDAAAEQPNAPPAEAKPVAEGALAKAEVAERRVETEQPKEAETPKAEEPRPLPKIDGGRKLPDEDLASESKTLKPGRADIEARVGEKDRPAVRPDDAVASRPQPAGGSAGKGIAAPPRSSSSLRDTSDEAKSRKKGTPEIRVGGKKFYSLNGVWTDKDYNPKKEMPVVPVIRDSDHYKELLARHAGLKIYFDRFVEERAIIVFENTVYKLSPPEK